MRPQVPPPLFPLEAEQGGRKVLPRRLSSLDVASKCTLGCAILDGLLGGGIPTRSVTELAGESTAGKTQLCLQLALTVQLPVHCGGLAGSALYIYTEGRFPFQRLQELAPLYSRRIGWKAADKMEISSTSNATGDPCENVFLEEFKTMQELQGYLEWLLPIRLQQPIRFPVKIIVIDSLANLFRTEFDNNVAELSKRAAALFRLSICLKRYAEQYDLAVVITNQVTDSMTDKEASCEGILMCMNGCQGRYMPALGLGWANCVTSRILLSRLPSFFSPSMQYGTEQGVSEGDTNPRRRMQVIFAPHLPQSSCNYVVQRAGVMGLSS